MSKNISLKDFHGKTVRVGDKVTLLYIERGFRGIDRAYLFDTIYLGKGRWGYEFKNGNSKWFPVIRVRKPQCIKLSNKKKDSSRYSSILYSCLKDYDVSFYDAMVATSCESAWSYLDKTILPDLDFDSFCEICNSIWLDCNQDTGLTVIADTVVEFITDNKKLPVSYFDDIYDYLLNRES